MGGLINPLDTFHHEGAKLWKLSLLSVPFWGRRVNLSSSASMAPAAHTVTLLSTHRNVWFFCGIEFMRKKTDWKNPFHLHWMVAQLLAVSPPPPPTPPPPSLFVILHCITVFCRALPRSEPAPGNLDRRRWEAPMFVRTILLFAAFGLDKLIVCCEAETLPLSPSSPLPAQVHDDEQFVPDFQSNNCEYPLLLYYLNKRLCSSDKRTRHALFMKLERLFRNMGGASRQSLSTLPWGQWGRGSSVCVINNCSVYSVTGGSTPALADSCQEVTGKKKPFPFICTCRRFIKKKTQWRCTRVFMTFSMTPAVILTTAEALGSSRERVWESRKAEITAEGHTGPNKTIKVDCLFLQTAIVHEFMCAALPRCRLFCSLRVG